MYEELKERSTEELKKMVDEPDDYTPEAIEYACNLLIQRGVKTVSMQKQSTHIQRQKDEQRDTTYEAVYRMESYIKTIKNCCVYFTAISIATGVLMLILCLLIAAA